MNTLSIWNPFVGVDELWHNRLATALGGESELSAVWSPVVDIEETDTAYLISAELPGIDKEQVKVAVKDGVLTLSGERDLERKVEGKTFHRVERSHGLFARSFTLPENADADAVKANYNDGVLGIRVSKREETLAKSIEVRVE